MKKIKLLNSLFIAPLLVSPLMPIATSCAKKDEKKEDLVTSIYENTVKEFIELAKIPHPSLSLDKMRTHLKSKLTSYGYSTNQDTYGNLWFDIPATSGHENDPKLILQAHMDMVVAGLSEEGATTIGIKVVENTINGRKVLQSKGKATGEGVATSIGADDGIGVAIILSLAKNKSYAHGPIRGIFTADEELGLRGAEFIDDAALDTDFLLNLDGEGSAQHEYIIEKGCGGLSNYKYSKTYSNSVPTGMTKYKLVISGFDGIGFNDETKVIYTNDGEKVYGNANRLLLEVLQTIVGYDRAIQIGTFEHSKAYGAGALPKDATIQFATSASQGEIQQAINFVIDKFKDKYSDDYVNKVKCTLTADGNFTRALSTNDTKNILTLWGEKFPIGVLGWDGDTETEKVKNSYPLLNINFGNFVITEKENETILKVTACGQIGSMDRQAEITGYYENLTQTWIPGITIEKVKNYVPWKIGDQTKMLDLLDKSFKSLDITPYHERTRSGLEPSWFIKRRNTMQQACIGPRMDDIHSTNETLYLDTVPTIIKATMYVINNMSTLKE